MKKLLFKKLCNILDVIEIHGIEGKDLEYAIEKELIKMNISYSHTELTQLLAYLFTYHFLRDTTRGIDLSPCATIFAKADANSRIEALAIFECLYQYVPYRPIFQQLLTSMIHKLDLYGYLDEISYSICTQTNLFFEEDSYVRLRKEYLDDLKSMMAEYDAAPANFFPLSVTLCARYTSSIVAHEDPTIEYKNKSNSIVPYDHIKEIIHIIPRRGVPSDRNETKALQTFYKDTLFHEFDHACPICGIDLPHMLIASHIKPFRDCAHIYEAIDHNNGLLLCRNHDYLFDQGYISFAEDGHLLICKELQEKKDLFAFVLQKDFHLNAQLLTKERQLFLNYHREHIFKQ